MHDKIGRQFHNIRSKYCGRIIKTVGGDECGCRGGSDIKGLTAELKIAFRKIVEFEDVGCAAKRSAHKIGVSRRGKIEEAKTDFQAAGFAWFNSADDVIHEQIEIDA